MLCECLLVGGIPTPLKNMKVSWDDDIPNIWKVIKIHGSKMFQTTNQFVIYIVIITGIDWLLKGVLTHL